MNDEKKRVEDLAEMFADAINKGIKPIPVECPKCKETFDVSREANFQPETNLIAELHIEAGHMLQGRTVGAWIKNLADVLEGTARDSGVNVSAMVKEIGIVDGNFRVGFNIIRVAGDFPKRKGR